MVEELQQRDLDTLAHGEWPERYRCNQGTWSINEQIRLLCSTVVVAGCGGLGGWVIESLARMGVGQLIVVDPGVFTPSDSNRQLFCTEATRGASRAREAAHRMRLINPAILCHPLQKTIQACFSTVQPKADVLIDCLEATADRRELSRLCRIAGLPLIHGAARSVYGQVAVQTGRSDLLERFSSEMLPADPSPALAPGVMTVGAILALECCKLLLGQESALHDNWLRIDLQRCTCNRIPLP